jgi:hypothetical protein
MAKGWASEERRARAIMGKTLAAIEGAFLGWKMRALLAEADLRDLSARVDADARARKAIRKLLYGTHACPSCGEQTRNTTAGCDHCDFENK